MSVTDEPGESKDPKKHEAIPEYDEKLGDDSDDVERESIEDDGDS